MRDKRATNVWFQQHMDVPQLAEQPEGKDAEWEQLDGLELEWQGTSGNREIRAGSVKGTFSKHIFAFATVSSLLVSLLLIFSALSVCASPRRLHVPQSNLDLVSRNIDYPRPGCNIGASGSRRRDDSGQNDDTPVPKRVELNLWLFLWD